MRQKRLMLLGGLRYLLPVIEAAHEQGYYVITVDYIPENIAHKYSDEYHNVSIIDKEAVLQLARQLQIDGIMSFAVDPGVITAAYVQDKMNLPAFGPYESVEILQNKDKFREFLSCHGFNVPIAKGYGSVEEAMEDSCNFPWPVIVKPTDSAGSKGVTRVNNAELLRPALEHAMKYSISGRVVVEEFIEKQGCSSDSDCFSVNGELRFVSFSAQRFDENAAGIFVPAAFSWPSSMSMQHETELRLELQRLLTLLRMNTSIYNVETRVGTNGKPYIMEVSPRGGGNRLAEMIRFSTGVDMITASVRAAVGDTVEGIGQKPLNGHWAEVILHSSKNGTYNSLFISTDLRPYVFQEDLWIKKGNEVRSFVGANDAIGTLVCKFETNGQLEYYVSNIEKYIKVCLI